MNIVTLEWSYELLETFNVDIMKLDISALDHGRTLQFSNYVHLPSNYVHRLVGLPYFTYGILCFELWTSGTNSKRYPFGPWSKISFLIDGMDPFKVPLVFRSLWLMDHLIMNCIMGVKSLQKGGMDLNKEVGHNKCFGTKMIKIVRAYEAFQESLDFSIYFDAIWWILRAFTLQFYTVGLPKGVTRNPDNYPFWCPRACSLKGLIFELIYGSLVRAKGGALLV